MTVTNPTARSSTIG